VSADAVRLQQVFWNVLKNAVKFSARQGNITIRSWNEDRQLRAVISDTGLGITSEELPRIFDAFAQGAQAAEARFGGLGLGLSISALLVREHGGRIWAESPGRNQGASFHVELPLAPISSGEGAMVEPPPSVARRTLRILVVEDHEATRETLVRLLTRRGHHVESGTSVAEGLERARRCNFDLVISDLGLPDGHGNDLMRALRSEVNLPGIALSGYGMQIDIEESKTAGFQEHLTKPIDISQLDAAIQRIAKDQQSD
jgi:CheY-like chemotaxis protein